MSPASSISRASKSSFTRRSPSPSTSIAPRLTKCSTDRRTTAGQTGFEQYAITSVSGRSTGSPETGQRSGISNGSAPSLRRLSTGPTTCGMTSPARRTMTVSPSRRSLRCTSSSLCSVAMPTVTPPTTTGSRIAKGFRLPVRPTFTSMRSRVVVASAEGNLYAVAQRGSRPTAPSCRWTAKSSILTTTPSMSIGSASRRGSQAAQAATVASSPGCRTVSGVVGKPIERSHSSVSQCVPGVAPSAQPSWYTAMRSGRLAVIFGSFCRTAPAAALRGLAKVRCGFLPAATSAGFSSSIAAFIASKPAFGM